MPLFASRVLISREVTYIQSAPDLVSAHTAAGQIGQREFDFVIQEEGPLKAKVLSTREHPGNTQIDVPLDRGVSGPVEERQLLLDFGS